jgi:hypothetical protein
MDSTLAAELWAFSSFPVFSLLGDTCEFHDQDTQGVGYRQRRVRLWRMFFTLLELHGYTAGLVGFLFSTD